MGNGVEASLTGTARLEVVLVGAIVVLAAVLLLVRFLRSTEHKRRKGASAYFDRNAANPESGGRNTSTGTAVYPTSGSPAPQPMAPSFAAPRRGASQPDGAPPPRSRASAGTPRGTVAPGVTTPDGPVPVKSPVLDPVPPLRTEGFAMPRPEGSAPPPAPMTTTPRSTSSPRTAVPANLPPMAPPPPRDAVSEDTGGAGASDPAPRDPAPRDPAPGDPGADSSHDD